MKFLNHLSIVLSRDGPESASGSQSAAGGYATEHAQAVAIVAAGLGGNDNTLVIVRE